MDSLRSDTLRCPQRLRGVSGVIKGEGPSGEEREVGPQSWEIWDIVSGRPSPLYPTKTREALPPLTLLSPLERIREQCLLLLLGEVSHEAYGWPVS